MLVLPNIRQDEDDIEIEKVNRETRRLFTEAGMPVFDNVKNAFSAVAAVSGYYRSADEIKILLSVSGYDGLISEQPEYYK